MNNKKAGMLNQTIVQIILIAIIFSLFLISTAGKINGKGIKQQVLEKELALLIDSAVPGMKFEVYKVNVNGIISSIKLSEERIFVNMEGLNSFEGYPYFSKYKVSLVEEKDKFVINIG